MMKLEKMDDFFAARIDGYDEHMKRDIEGASGFYAYTASLLPSADGSRVLDLGCGTGLELEEYFAVNPRRGRYGDRSVRSDAECAERQIPGEKPDAGPRLLF